MPDVPDSSDVDSALVAKLQADAELATLAPDGVWIDDAPEGKRQFVIVSLVDSTDEPMHGGTAFEDGLYLVKFVELSTVAVRRAKRGAARIHELLHLGTLTMEDYGLMIMRRVARVRMTEVDAVDASIRWQHRGGRYQVMVAPRKVALLPGHSTFDDGAFA